MRSSYELVVTDALLDFDGCVFDYRLRRHESILDYRVHGAASSRLPVPAAIVF